MFVWTLYQTKLINWTHRKKPQTNQKKTRTNWTLEKPDKPYELAKHFNWLTRNLRTWWSGFWAFVDIAVWLTMRSSNKDIIFGQSNTDSKRAIASTWKYVWWSGIDVVCPNKMGEKQQKNDCCLQHFVKTVNRTAKLFTLLQLNFLSKVW